MGVGNEVWIGDKEKNLLHGSEGIPHEDSFKFDVLRLLLVTSET